MNESKLYVGIEGLGLIGGNFTKTYHEAGYTVLETNRTRDTLEFAMMNGIVDGELTEESIPNCNLVIIALYPLATIDYLTKMAPYIANRTIVIYTCGVKRKVCTTCFLIPK
ncbi:Prephenate dehydrogenase [gut metagenome]|uniref:Prephenate dehydrogenase n=1 Tax=gut metagenome TaxID=749906 RepID=J9FZI1_9ZZZZ